MAGGTAAEAGVAAEITLEHTPTWIVASVCSVIVVISLLFERMLHRLGKRLLKKSKKIQYEALVKIQKGLLGDEDGEEEERRREGAAARSHGRR
ncbi:unnamed protein product [Urochloa humidicola]